MISSVWEDNFLIVAENIKSLDPGNWLIRENQKQSGKSFKPGKPKQSGKSLEPGNDEISWSDAESKEEPSQIQDQNDFGYNYSENKILVWQILFS